MGRSACILLRYRMQILVSLLLVTCIIKVRGQREIFGEHTYKDYIGEWDKKKLVGLSEEIVRDMNKKILQMDVLREEHGSHLLFEIGSLLGQIKEKYMRQFDMYRQMWNKYNKTSRIMAPEDTRAFRPANYLIVLEFIVAKQLEIEQLVEIVLKVPNEDLFKYTPPPQKIIIASSFHRLLRTRDPRKPKEPGEFLEGPAQEAVEQEMNRMAQEERLKMRYRAEYMKRHRNNNRK